MRKEAGESELKGHMIKVNNKSGMIEMVVPDCFLTFLTKSVSGQCCA